tara:strand:+ start:141 stop:1133 length:993 start_codon:yes stop_codon:yes gene_type:complete
MMRANHPRVACLKDATFLYHESYAKRVAQGGYNVLFAHNHSNVVVRLGRPDRGCKDFGKALRAQHAIIVRMRNECGSMLPDLLFSGFDMLTYRPVQIWERFEMCCQQAVRTNRYDRNELLCSVAACVCSIADAGFLNCDLKLCNMVVRIRPRREHKVDDEESQGVALDHTQRRCEDVRRDARLRADSPTDEPGDQNDRDVTAGAGGLTDACGDSEEDDDAYRLDVRMIDIDDKFIINAEDIASRSGVALEEVRRAFASLMLQMLAVQNTKCRLGEDLCRAVAMTHGVPSELVPFLDSIPALKGTFRRYYAKEHRVRNVSTLHQAVLSVAR